MDRKLLTLVLAFFVVLGAFAVVLLDRNAQLTRAASQTPSSGMSFLIVSAQQGECSVSAVVRDSAQKGVPNREVCVTSTLGSVSTPCQITDESGIAQFKVISATAGAGQITAQVTNQFQISTQVSCQFTP